MMVSLSGVVGGSSWLGTWGTLGVAVGIALLVIWVVQNGGKTRKGPIQWPLLGSTVEVLWNYDHLNDWLVPYFEKYGLTFRCVLVDVSYVFTADPANVEHILKTNFNNYPKGSQFHEKFDVFLGNGIFNADGENWRKERKTASLQFSSNVLRDFSIVVFRDYSVALADILHGAAMRQQSVDMQDLFMRYTLDSIYKIAFGIDVDTLKANLPDVPFARAFETTNEVCSGRFMDPLWKLKRAFNIGSEAKLSKSAKVVDAFIFNVIKTRKAELAALKSAGMEDQARKDIFTRSLLSSANTGEYLSDRNFRDTMLNFVLAGRDTTAVTLSWFVYMMILHPEVAQKIHEELQHAYNEHEAVTGEEEEAAAAAAAEVSSFCEQKFHSRLLTFSQRLTYDSLMNLHYLHASLLETLRLYPAVPMDPKSVLADDVLPDGTVVKGGSMVSYSAFGMGRMTSLWGADAKQFKPERWLVDGVVQMQSLFKFTTFQAGPRICLGKDSAMMQLRMTGAIICRFFTFQVIPGFIVKPRQMSTLLMTHGLHVNVATRS